VGGGGGGGVGGWGGGGGVGVGVGLGGVKANPIIENVNDRCWASFPAIAMAGASVKAYPQ
jgi:hypothetical protein